MIARLGFYAVVWLLCNMAIAACIAVLAALLVFYTAVGPFACVYVGARLGSWCGFNLFVNAILMLAGLWLFGSIRLGLYRHVLRWWRRAILILESAVALRDDLWRQYRRSLNTTSLR